MDCFNIKALSDLLQNKDEDSDSEDEKPKSTPAKMGPGDVGPAKKPQTLKTQEPKVQSKDIWDSESVNTGAEYEDVYDPRPQPEYDIIYKQAVTSEDMFLQMGSKNVSTASCEDMIVKIKLPDTKLPDVTLDVKDTFLDCRTNKYKLGLHLPHPVDGKNGSAQWDGNLHTLTVTLRMTREYDFLNF